MQFHEYFEERYQHLVPLDSFASVFINFKQRAQLLSDWRSISRLAAALNTC